MEVRFLDHWNLSLVCKGLTVHNCAQDGFRNGLPCIPLHSKYKMQSDLFTMQSSG